MRLSKFVAFHPTTDRHSHKSDQVAAQETETDTDTQVIGNKITEQLSSPHTESVVTLSQPDAALKAALQPKVEYRGTSVMDSFISDVQSSTVKQEETPTADHIQFKLRRRVCKKICQILHTEIGLKIAEAEKITLAFEQAIFNAYSDSISDYIRTIKTMCNKVKVRCR